MDTNLIKDTAKNVLSRVGFSLKKASPEIFLFAGLGGLVGSTVLACIATLEAKKKVENHKEAIQYIKDQQELSQNIDGGETYTKEDMDHDIGRMYVRTAGELALLYAPALGLEILSITAILSSHNIMKERNLGLAAAFAGLGQTFKEYRENVKEKYGEEEESKIRHNVETHTYEETVIDENGKKKKVKKTVDFVPDDKVGKYARFFNEECTGWDKNPDYSLAFLRLQEDFATKQLRATGHLYLNEVYDMLGIPRTREGQYIGWLYKKNNPDGENFVDFGLYKTSRLRNIDAVNGYEDVFLLDFNVDGPIIDKVEYVK